MDVVKPEREFHSGAIAFVGLALVATVWIAHNIRALGFRIDQPDIGQDYAMGVLWWFFIAVGIAWSWCEDRKLLLTAWVVKFFVVLVAMLFYEQRYGLDAYWYFKVTVTGEHPHYTGIDWRKEWFLFEDPTRGLDKHRLGQGTDNMIRLVMFFSIFTGKYYHALKVIFAFFGLLGAWAFYRAIVVILGRPVPIAFYWLAFFPSILFWSSILGKDPLIFLLLGVSAYGAARVLVRGELVGGVFLAIGLVLGFNVRPWTAVMAGVCLLPALLFRGGHGLQRSVLVLLMIQAMLYGWEPISDRFHINELSDFSKLFVILTEGQDVQSEWTVYNAEFGGVQRAAGAVEVVQQIQSGNVGGALPIIIFSGLFRPLPFEVRNAFSAMAALENCFLLFLVLVAMKRMEWEYLRHQMVLWSIFYSLVWAAFYGAILLANFGAGARYKLQVLPFMVMVLFLVLHPQGLTSRERATAKELTGQLRRAES